MAIAWNCYLLALHPDVQKKVQEELDMVLGEHKTEEISTENLKDLKYLECVVKVYVHFAVKIRNLLRFRNLFDKHFKRIFSDYLHRKCRKVKGCIPLCR